MVSSDKSVIKNFLSLPHPQPGIKHPGSRLGKQLMCLHCLQKSFVVGGRWFPVSRGVLLITFDYKFKFPHFCFPGKKSIFNIYEGTSPHKQMEIFLGHLLPW